MAAFGIELIQRETDVKPVDPVFQPFEILAENYDAACLFLSCRTQWLRETHIPPMGGKVIIAYHGLDYQAVDVVMHRRRQFRNSKDPELFEKLQLMEDEALQILNTRQ